MNCRGLYAQLKDIVPVTGLCPQEGPYGVQDTLRSRFSSVRNEQLPSYPQELLEKKIRLAGLKWAGALPTLALPTHKHTYSAFRKYSHPLHFFTFSCYKVGLKFI
uniref:Uncharacterized protein n=1 Tax=Oncorhynchus tshawytscha TaxID=74940 RepID=A0A8C8EPG5_ONCTS